MASIQLAIVPLLCIILAIYSFGLLHDNEKTGAREYANIGTYWKWASTFLFLFLFRYVRLLVNIIGFLAYRPAPIPQQPTLTSKDVTVIIPTVDSGNPDFSECLNTVAANNPASIVIVTADGEEVFDRACAYRKQYRKVTVIASDRANKRAQVCKGLGRVHTAITVLCDDHVFWPTSFLASVLAPFEDRSVGAVGTNKRVRRTPIGFSWPSFWNFLGCLYLERHNFELAATNHLDGGVFVISGRTAAYRSSILKDRGFIKGFLNEYTFFGLCGPLNADDDNFITRWCVNHGWKIKFQYSDASRIETTLGTYPKFLSQCLRWVRTTWRSNPTSLFVDRTVWHVQPWCVYAVYVSSFFNFALFYDTALIWSLYRALNTSPDWNGGTKVYIFRLGLWILASKLVKPSPHFWRNPKDLYLLPGYILFGYYHSLIKLYAMFTFWDVAWSGRPGLAVK